MSTFYKTKEKIFQTVQTGPWHAVVPINVVEVAEPAHRWAGGKIKLEQVQQATAFFEWALKENPRDEALVHFYYNDTTKEWKVIAPLQKCVGLSVEPVGLKSDSVYYDRQKAILEAHVPSSEWVLAGSLHHHVNIGAFQSGTDSSDEAKYFGIHLTLGYMDRQVYDLHGRVSFKGVFTRAYLADWFELEGTDLYPDALADEMIAWHLRQHAPEGAIFPDWWKESIVKSVITPYEPAIYYGLGFGSSADTAAIHTPTHRVETPVEGKKIKAKERSFFKLEDDLQTLTMDFGCSGKQIADHIHHLIDENPVLEDLICIIAEHDTSVDDALGVLAAINDKDMLWQCNMCKEPVYGETQSDDGLCEDCRDFYHADRINDI